MIEGDKISVLIIEDSIAYADFLRNCLEKDGRFRVLGIAPDPYYAVKLIFNKTPDVITLDIEMPRMNGVTFLRKMMQQYPIPTLIITKIERNKVKNYLEALFSGAIDIVSKQEIDAENEDSLKELCDKIHYTSFSNLKAIRLKEPQVDQNKTLRPLISVDPVILIGASTGGTVVISKILANVSGDIPPIIIVQHMPEFFVPIFVEQINKETKLEVEVARANTVPQKGHVYISEGGKHLVLRKRGEDILLDYETGGKVNHVIPSVDKLFLSAAEANPKRYHCFLLSGMGNDGAEGLFELKNNGASTFAQNEESSIIYGMPRKAVEIGAVLKSLSPKEIADYISNLK